jgi:hypothetical protein
MAHLFRPSAVAGRPYRAQLRNNAYNQEVFAAVAPLAKTIRRRRSGPKLRKFFKALAIRELTNRYGEDTDRR